MKLKYYSLDKIIEKKAPYNVIFGERSNGKSFAVLKYGVEDFFNSGKVNQIAIIRRRYEDFVGANSARTCFDSLMHDGNGVNQIKKISKGEYDGIEYYGGKWYLSVYDSEKERLVKTDVVIAVAFALSMNEHYKSGSYPHIKTILFDEFMTNNFYLSDEFILFQNVLSTIIRARDDVKIFMCANTVSKYGCPYFREMGLTHIKEMKQGDIDLYTYGDTKLTVAVEFSDSPNKSKPSDIYFSFDNPKLKMITNGVWEMNIYPHLPQKYAPKDILFSFFIVFDGATLQADVILIDDLTFIYIHTKTTNIKNPDTDLIYRTDFSARPNIKRNILKPDNKKTKLVYNYFATDKVFYQNNEIGEIVSTYLKWCRTN